MRVRSWIIIPVLLAIVLGLFLAPRPDTATGKEPFPSLGPLGPVPTPPDNPTTPAKVELGKMLFFDNRLSGDTSTPCLSCHVPQVGWGDGGDICRGYPGTKHWRNCQTIVNSAYYNKLFWAGSSKSLEAQAETAARGAVAGNGERDMMEARLLQIPEYVKRFKEVFGTHRPHLKDAWRAIAAFERTIVQRNTPFDRYMKGDKGAMSAKAVNGLALFSGKAGCIQCHNGSLLTDQKYYNLGVPENPTFQRDAQHQITFRYEQYAKGVTEDIYRTTKTDLGLYYRMKRKEDMGKFRTPSLRYLVYTAPYIHNGVFRTLEEVIEFYNKGGGEDIIQSLYGFSTKTNKIKPLNLTENEKGALKAFLESLSGEQIIVNPPKLPEYAVYK
ncbi:cytochrome-c peroxidase [Nitrospinae bacterium AH_259_B05_G02_I21]|nr:cytochrome-c peroxidase [Nitrospinae bacterium AH_259_B05_G02_I21]MDA2932515.1 cytochrome-c peroxidase [Nitrospinae bacterium AH-259-F20]